MKITINIEIGENELDILRKWDMGSTPPPTTPPTTSQFTTPISHIAPPPTSRFAPTPKHDPSFSKFRNEIWKMIDKFNFEKSGIIYVCDAGDGVYVHLCPHENHISLYVYEKGTQKIYLIMYPDMKVERRMNNFVDNYTVKKIVGLFLKYLKYVD